MTEDRRRKTENRRPGAGRGPVLKLAVEKRLDALAQATGRTKTSHAREAILAHLDDLEDLYLAEQRLIDLRAGKTQTVPLEEAMKRHGGHRKAVYRK